MPKGGYPITRQWIETAPGVGAIKAARSGALLSALGIGARIETIIAGDTGWSGLTARAAAADPKQAFGHLIVDDLDVIECIPAVTSRAGRVERAYFIEPRPGEPDPHSSSIFVNFCFGAPMDSPAAYLRWVDVVASLCVRFSVEPRSNLRRAADFDRTRNDPELALKAAGRTFQEFQAAVVSAVAAVSE